MDKLTSAQWLILVTIFISISCSGVATALLHIMIARMNRRLPPDQQKSHFMRWYSVVREHRKLYPDSRLPNYMLIFSGLVVLCFVLVILEWKFLNSVGS
jgi:amino acid transporter